MLKKILGRKENKYNFAIPKPTKDTCPYCGFKFEKVPTRKKKCPECENYIFVRRGELFTEEEKNIKDWLENYWVEELGITRRLFNETRQKLSKEFGFVASVNDTLWRVLNRINTPDKGFTYRKIAYQVMESVLKAEGKSTDEVVAQAHQMEMMEGKIANEASAKAFRKELLEIKKLNESGIEMVALVSTCNDQYVCDECKKLSKMVFTIDEALETMPIPHKCTNAQCRCHYGFTFPDDI